MTRYLPWFFLVIGIAAMTVGFIKANAVVFGLGLFFTVIGGADVAERLLADDTEEVA